MNTDELSKDVVTGCFKINSVISTQHNRLILAYGKPIRFVITEKRIQRWDTSMCASCL